MLHDDRVPQDRSQDGEPRVPHTFVVGAVLTMFAAHVIVNLVHAFRSYRLRIVRREIRREPGEDADAQQESPDEVPGAEGQVPEGPRDAG
jgi:hypothetical protein